MNNNNGEKKRSNTTMLQWRLPFFAESRDYFWSSANFFFFGYVFTLNHVVAAYVFHCFVITSFNTPNIYHDLCTFSCKHTNILQRNNDWMANSHRYFFFLSYDWRQFQLVTHYERYNHSIHLSQLETITMEFWKQKHDHVLLFGLAWNQLHFLFKSHLLMFSIHIIIYYQSI